MGHGLREEVDKFGALGLFFVAFDAAGFIELAEGLGEGEEVGADEVRGEVVGGCLEDRTVVQKRFD